MNGRLTMLIKVLDSKIHAYKEGEIPHFLGHTELKKISGLVRQLCQRAIFVMNQVIEGQQQEQESSTSSSSVLEIDDVSEVYTALVLILQTSSTLLTLNDQGPAEFKEMLVEDDALKSVTGKKK